MPLQFTFLFEQAPFASCHASTVAEIGGGGAPWVLAAAWFGSEREGAGDVAIWLSRRLAGHWTPPEKAAVAEGVPCWIDATYTWRRQRIRHVSLLPDDLPRP